MTATPVRQGKSHNTFVATPPARPHERNHRKVTALQLNILERIDARARIIGHYATHRAWGDTARYIWRNREYGTIAIATWLALVPWLWANSFPPGYTIRCAVVAAIVGWPFAWLTGDGHATRLVHREQRFLDPRMKPTPRVSHVDELHHGPIHHATEIKGKIAHGLQPGDVENQEPTLAVLYGDRARHGVEVTVAPSGNFNIRLNHRDLLAKPAPYTPSDATGAALRLGMDRDGQETLWTPTEARMLIAGMSGAGKSTMLNAQLAQLAAHGYPLYLIDPHRTDFKPWYPHATKVARDIPEALTVLAAAVQAHLAELDANDTDDTDMADGVKRVLVVDELAYLTHKARPHAKAVLGYLEQLATGGRKSGTVILAATQYPETDVIPSSIRGQFTHRIGLRCEFDAATDVIFGTGARPQGIRLAKLPAGQPGRGILLHGGRFTEIRGYTLWGEAKKSAAKAISTRRHPTNNQHTAPTTNGTQPATVYALPAPAPTEKQGNPTSNRPFTTAELREACLEAVDLADQRLGVRLPKLAEKLDVPVDRLYRQMVALRKLGSVRTDGTAWYREQP